MAVTEPCQCSLKQNSFSSFYIGDKLFYGPTGAYRNTIYFDGLGGITFDQFFAYYYAYVEYQDFKYEFQIIDNGSVIQTTGEFSATIFTSTGSSPYKTTYNIPYRSISMTDPYKDGRFIHLRVKIKINGTVYQNKDFYIPSVPVVSTIQFSCPSSMETGKVYSF